MSMDAPYDRKQLVYELRELLKKANRALRDAEDLVRLNPGLWGNVPTADRIREIYEQVTEDVLEGRATRPPLMQRVRIAEDNATILADRLAELGELDSVLARLK
jgi:hypothetical protein